MSIFSARKMGGFVTESISLGPALLERTQTPNVVGHGFYEAGYRRWRLRLRLGGGRNVSLSRGYPDAPIRLALLLRRFDATIDFRSKPREQR